MVQLSLADIILSSLGGILIGLATSFHLATKGRITGFSGILFSLLTYDKTSFFWQLSLICGLTASSSILFCIFQFNKVWDNTQIFDSPELMIDRLNYIGFALAGFLVGVGTKMANGCTSGHGVCGLPRFSKRSWLAVGIFFPTGIALATIRHHFHFLHQMQSKEFISQFNYDICAAIILSFSLFIFLLILTFRRQSSFENVISFITGLIFGMGLGFGGMLRRSKINNFLSLYEDWDPSLMFVLCFAVGFNMISFRYILKQEKPLLSEKFFIVKNNVIDLKLAFGAFLFGFGWGLGSLCPGPGIALVSVFSLQIGVVWMGCVFAGQLCVKALEKYAEKKMRTKVRTLSSDQLQAQTKKNDVNEVVEIID